VVTVQFNPTVPGTFTCDVQTGATSCGEVLCTGIGDATVPVMLQTFDARWSGSDVEISWELLKTTSNLTVDVARKEGNEGSFVPIQRPEIIEEGNQFVFHDRSTVPEKTYTYWIVILEGGAAATSFQTTITTPALQLALDQNRPNPFNPTTTISFVLPREMDVKLSIYDIRGRRIVTLLDGTGSAGSKEVVWDGKDANGNQVGSGVYFYRLQAGKDTQTRKMILLK
jgi:hypothetical protein